MNDERDPQVGGGARGGGWLTWALVLEGAFLVTALPSVLAVMFLARSAANVPVLALCMVPLGPALAATVFAWHRRRWTPPGQPELGPAAAFLRGYRLNWRDVLWWWVPVLVVLAVLGYKVVGAGLVGGDGQAAHVGVSTFVFVVLVAAVLVWAGNALVLTSLFSFRTRDLARLATYYVGAKPMTGVGVVGLVVVAFAIEWMVGDWLLVVLASTLVAVLVRSSATMVAQARARFTPPAVAAADEPA